MDLVKEGQIMTSSRPSEDDLPRTLSAPARRALVGAGYTSLAQLTAVTEQELFRLHGMGSKAVRQLKAALAERGLALAATPRASD